MLNRLHIVDLDGTVNDIDIRLAFEGRGSPEVAAYGQGAIWILHAEISHRLSDLVERLG